MKIIKGFNFRFKIANLDTGKDWRVQIYAGKVSYDVTTEWQGTELICTLSAEVTDTMSVGYYNIIIFERENTIPPKCNVFEVIDVKNGGCMSCECDIKIINEENKIIVTEETNVIVVSHADGRDGKSAYQQAVEGGYTGTEQEFNCSLSLLADVADGKKQIAEAINTKGGNASADSSFLQLADDILAMPTSGILANGITQTEPFSFLKYLTSDINNEITEINDSEITTITRDFAFYKNIALREVSFFNLVSILSDSTFKDCASLQSVEFPSIVTISGSNIFNNTQLQSVEFPSLVNIKGNNIFSNNVYLKSFIAPNLSNLISGAYFGATLFLNNIVIGKVQVMSREIFYSNQTHLRNITIGPNTDVNTLFFQSWTATNVINEGQSGIDELNSNLYNNLLTKLYDHSTDGQTRTLRLGWLAHVTQENIDYANSKGWTLTT